MSVIVKICGITNVTDALAATDAGANALGFVFYSSSRRKVSPGQAGEIIRELPLPIVKIGVFVDADKDFVTDTIHECGLNAAQFHGDETPEYCEQFGIMTIKAFRVVGPETIATCATYSSDAFLLDSYSPGQMGGTGETFNWDLVLEAKKLGRPVFLAGGLTPLNVANAVRRVRPYGVDVSSGVEAEPGVKDHAKVRAFIEAARSAEEESQFAGG